MWNEGWDSLFSRMEWGKYPDVEVVRYFSRAYKEKREGVRVLEVGCGPGANLFFLAREGFSPYGIDGSKVAIERAEKRLKADGLKAELQVGDISKLPYADGFFDAVLDCECLYANSKAHSRGMLKEIARVLKPGGRFFSLTFATGTYGDGNGEKLAGEPNTYTKIHKGALHSDYGLIRFTSEEEIQDLYGKDFDIRSVEYVVRSMLDRKEQIKEWLIACEKKSEKRG